MGKSDILLRTLSMYAYDCIWVICLSVLLNPNVNVTYCHLTNDPIVRISDFRIVLSQILNIGTVLRLPIKFSAMEIEKLTSLGEQAGLAGPALLDFVKVERIELKQQRDEEREIRVADRAAEREKLEVEKAKIISERENRELEKEKLQLEKDRIEAQERLCQQQFEFDKQKAQAERDFVREQTKRKSVGKLRMKGVKIMMKLTDPDLVVTNHKVMVEIIIQSKVRYQNYRPLMSAKIILMHT